MNTRQKLYKKAHNIKKNNLEKRYRSAVVTIENARQIVAKFHAYQAFIRRQKHIKQYGKRFKHFIVG